MPVRMEGPAQPAAAAPVVPKTQSDRDALAKVVSTQGPKDPRVQGITLRKGIKLPTEPYGGDKYGSIEVSLEMTMEVTEGAYIESVTLLNNYIDEQVQTILEKEIEQLKGDK